MSRPTIHAAAHYRGPYLSSGGRVSVVINGSLRIDHDFINAAGAFDLRRIVERELSVSPCDLEELDRAVLHAVIIARRAFNTSRMLADG